MIFYIFSPVLSMTVTTTVLNYPDSDWLNIQPVKARLKKKKKNVLTVRLHVECFKGPWMSSDAHFHHVAFLFNSFSILIKLLTFLDEMCWLFTEIFKCVSWWVLVGRSESKVHIADFYLSLQFESVRRNGDVVREEDPATWSVQT